MSVVNNFAPAPAPSTPMELVETWQNVTKGRLIIRRFAHQGGMRTDMVAGGRKFVITPVERRLNQELAATEDLDMFSNGWLQPVDVPDAVEDAEIIKGNPNHISEAEMVELFSTHWKTFEKRVAEITNPATVRAFLDVAKSDEVNASVKQLQLLEGRLAVVGASEEVKHVKPNVDRGISQAGSINPVTPN